MASLNEFKALLVKREGNLARAWRLVLDPQGAGKVLQSDFCRSARQVAFRGSIRNAWEALDVDKVGVSLSGLDWYTADNLGRFYWTLMVQYGSIQQAALSLDLKDQRRLGREEFVAKLRERQLSSGRDAEVLFQMLDVTGVGSTRASVTKDSFLWLDALSPHLPRRPAAQRVPPGALPEEGHLSGGSRESSPDGICTAPSRGRSKSPSGETVHEKLYRQGREREIRHKVVAEIERQQPPASSPLGTFPKEVPLERFREMHEHWMIYKDRRDERKREAEEKLCQQEASMTKATPDRETFERLIKQPEWKAQAQARPSAKSAETPRPKLKDDPNHRCLDLYRRANEAKQGLGQRPQKNQGQGQQHGSVAAVEACAPTPRQEAISGERPRRADPLAIQKLYEDHAVQMQKRHDKRERLRAEEDRALLALATAVHSPTAKRFSPTGRSPPSTPGSVAAAADRLHHEASLRGHQLTAKQQQQAIELEEQMKSWSVHRHAAGGSDVFHRLYNKTKSAKSSPNGDTMMQKDDLSTVESSALARSVAEEIFKELDLPMMEPEETVDARESLRSKLERASRASPGERRASVLDAIAGGPMAATGKAAWQP